MILVLNTQDRRDEAMNFKQGFILDGEFGDPAEAMPRGPDGHEALWQVCKTAVLLLGRPNRIRISVPAGNYFRIHARHEINRVLE